jgi:hypothetical protein
MFAHHVTSRLGRQGSLVLWLLLAAALPLLVFGFCIVAADTTRAEFPGAPMAATGSGAGALAGLLDELTGDNGDFELAVALPFMIALVVVQTRWFAPRPIFASHVVLIETPPPRRLA